MGLVTQITVCLSKNSLESGRRLTVSSALQGMKVSIDLKTEPSLHEPLSIRFAIKELPPPIRLQFVNDTKKQHLLSEKGILWPGGTVFCSYQGSPHSPLCTAQRVHHPHSDPRQPDSTATSSHSCETMGSFRPHSLVKKQARTSWEKLGNMGAKQPTKRGVEPLARMF